MKRLSKRIFSFVFALILCICGVGAHPYTVKAAEPPAITITPLVTDSPSVQKFEVSTPVPAQYYAGEDESGNLERGVTTLTFNTEDLVSLQVFASYTDDNGNPQWHTVYQSSINEYYVTVSCVGNDDTELYKETFTLSKYNQSEVVYTAPASFDREAVVYETANPSIVFKYGEGDKTITYTAKPKAGKTYTVQYVDENNNKLYSQSATIAYGQPATLSAPATYTNGADVYNLKTTGSYDVTYENAQDVYTFEYVKQAPVEQKPYEITVKLVDEAGNVMHTITQGVDVGATATVNLPATYQVNLLTYKLADDQQSSITHEYDPTASKEYIVKYVLASELEPYTITINCVDQATGTVLDQVTGQVAPDGVPYTYDISSKNSITVGNKVYEVLSGQGNSNGKIVHTYGDAARSYDVYYTEKVETVLTPYTVSMTYICVNDNKVLAEETKEVAPDSSVTFAVAPATIKAGDKEYIRLNGQENATVHTYNDSQTAYAIYYRDAAVKLDSENGPEVIYENETAYIQIGEDIIILPSPQASTTTTQSGTTANAGTTTPGTTTTTPGTTGEETTEAVTGEETTESVTGEETTESVTGEETTESVTGEETQGSEVEIIDEDVPLANQPFEESNSLVMPIVVGGIVVVIAAVAGILFVSKRKKETEEE